jgi:hypothetical protein
MVGFEKTVFVVHSEDTPEKPLSISYTMYPDQGKHQGDGRGIFWAVEQKVVLTGGLINGTRVSEYRP